MKDRASAEIGPWTTADTAVFHPIPELPAWKAFIVQFSRDTGIDPNVVSGRIEHLSSGRRTGFDTPEELLTRLRTLLDEICGPPATRV